LLSEKGIEPFTPEAVPSYLAWIRQDLVLAISLLNGIATYAKYAALLLAVIAVILIYRAFH